MSDYLNIKVNKVGPWCEEIQKTLDVKSTGLSDDAKACIKLRYQIARLTAAAAFGALIHLAAFFLKAVTLPFIAIAHLVNSKTWKEKLPEAGDIPKHLFKVAIMFVAMGMGSIGILTPARWTMTVMGKLQLDPQVTKREEQKRAEVEKQRNEEINNGLIVQRTTDAQTALIAAVNEVNEFLKSDPKPSLVDALAAKLKLALTMPKVETAVKEISVKWSDPNKKPTTIKDAEESAKKTLETARIALQKIEDIEVPAYVKEVDESEPKVTAAAQEALEAVQKAAESASSLEDVVAAAGSAKQKQSEMQALVTGMSGKVGLVRDFYLAAAKELVPLKSVSPDNYDERQKEKVARSSGLKTHLQKMEEKLATAQTALDSVTTKLSNIESREQIAQKITKAKTRLIEVEGKISTTWETFIGAYQNETPDDNAIWEQVKMLLELDSEMAALNIDLVPPSAAKAKPAAPTETAEAAEADAETVPEAAIEPKERKEITDKRKADLMEARANYESALKRKAELESVKSADSTAEDPLEGKTYEEQSEILTLEHTIALYQYEIAHWVQNAAARFVKTHKYAAIGEATCILQDSQVPMKEVIEPQNNNAYERLEDLEEDMIILIEERIIKEWGTITGSIKSSSDDIYTSGASLGNLEVQIREKFLKRKSITEAEKSKQKQGLEVARNELRDFNVLYKKYREDSVDNGFLTEYKIATFEYLIKIYNRLSEIESVKYEGNIVDVKQAYYANILHAIQEALQKVRNPV